MVKEGHEIALPAARNDSQAFVRRAGGALYRLERGEGSGPVQRKDDWGLVNAAGRKRK